jgi:isopenicillin-N N-acyltransferase-like protein
MRPCVLIPALDAAGTVGDVVAGLREEFGDHVPILVIDDGSTDRTAEVAEAAGATVHRHPKNLGKGAAIRTGLRAAERIDCDVAITVDADGQHPAREAARLLAGCDEEGALVLGMRDLSRSGAPRSNLVGNHVANFFVSVFTRRRFRDTQCGLRRYPVRRALSLRTHDQRFGFEAEIIFAALRGGVKVVEVPVTVIYPPPSRHTTRYRTIKDTVHIVFRITWTILFPVRWALAGAAVLALLALVHPAIVLATRMLPPDVAVPHDVATEEPGEPGLRRVGSDYARHRGKIWEVALSGSPERIGAHHVALLRDEMLANETQLWSTFESAVPSALARLLIFDIARLRFRNIESLLSDVRRREIAAAALAFSPDPWAARIPSYQRMVYLHSLYDVSLSFEHSPLIGCTSFALTGAVTASGHTLLARNFDFEAGSIFDDHKAVFLMHETGRIPYASVSWPGLVGTVTGMNERGLALVVHGGRAREPRSSGEPLVHTMRDVLGQARSVEEAIALFRRREPMVSHIVMVADASGDVAVIERAPGEPPFVRRSPGKIALTNHFEGPWTNDPANAQVKRETSTLARRSRLDELLSRLRRGATVDDAVAILRDKRGVGDAMLPLGDRRAIDALIATHGVVIDTTDKTMWVSEGPHLLGRFIRFDVARLLAADQNPQADEDPIAVPPGRRPPPARGATPPLVQTTAPTP